MSSIDLPQGITLNIDFDGTVVTHDFPAVGKDIGAVPVLRELVEAGHKLILFTMRSGTYLDDAVAWFAAHDLPLYGINTNPTQTSWTQSPKSYAQKMIDDSAVCAPLVVDPSLSSRPFIDWVRMRELLVEHGLLTDRVPTVEERLAFLARGLQYAASQGWISQAQADEQLEVARAEAEGEVSA